MSDLPPGILPWLPPRRLGTVNATHALLLAEMIIARAEARRAPRRSVDAERARRLAGLRGD